MAASPVHRPDELTPGAHAAAADHELAARLARGWVLQHRPARTRADVLALVDDVRHWQSRTLEQLARRTGDPHLVIAYDAATGPLVTPDPARPVRDQLAQVREQVEARVEWLEGLRGQLPGGIARHQPEPVPPPVVVPSRPQRDVLVVHSAATSTATSVISALSALGEGQPAELVLEEGAGLAELRTSPRTGAVVVIVEGRAGTPTTSSALALGWAAGALGQDRVLAVLTPGVALGPELGPVAVVPARGRTRWRAEVVAWAAAATLA